MMNGKHLFSVAVAAGLVGFMSLSAVGEVTTIRLDEMTPVTKTTTYNITTTYITGPSGFELSNNATLTFNTAGTSTNDFEGGIIINLGSALVSGTYNTYGTPFGKDPVITLHCDGTKRCLFKGGQHTIAKLITTGNSTTNFPAIDAYYTDLTFNELVIGGDLCIDTSYTRASSGSSKNKYAQGTNAMWFKCPVNAGKTFDVWFTSHGLICFNDRVTCKEFIGYYAAGATENSTKGGVGGAILGMSDNDFDAIRLDNQSVWANADMAVNGAALIFEGGHDCHTPPTSDGKYQFETGFFSINSDSKAGSRSQRVKWIESDERARDAYGYKVKSAAKVFGTLFIGGEANKTADACVAVNDKVNLEIAASAPASFRQIFRNRESTMTGTIAVRGGTLEIASGATFSNATAVAVGGGAALVIGSDTAPFNENIDLALEGGATLTLSGDLKVKSLTFDGVAYPAGTYTEVAGTTLHGGAIEVAEGPAVENPVFVYAAEGETVTNPAGLTDDAHLFKFGDGRLVLTGANDFTGGTELHAGVIEMQDAAALGSGLITVYGSQDHESCLVFDKDGMTVANSILIASDSTTNYPALHFAKPTTLQGASFHADGNCYFSTAFDDDAANGTVVKVAFNTFVTAAEGKRIAGAPHCQVNFRYGIQVPILEGFWLPGAAANGGNAGRLCVTKVNESAPEGAVNEIGRIILDQTSFYCGNSYVANGATVEFTGEHPENGYGYFDIAGTEETLGGVYTGEKCATATEGLQIMNSSATAKTLTLGNTGGSANWYFVLEGDMGLKWASGGTAPTFKHRRHTLSATSVGHNTRSINFGEGAEFPNITTSTGSGSGHWYIDSETDVFSDKFTSASDGSSSFRLTSEGAVRCMSRGHRFNYSTGRTGNPFSTSYGLFTPAGTTLDLASANVHIVGQVEDYTVTHLLPCGKYAPESSYELHGGWFRVWAPRTAWTNVTWNGEADADLGVAANWTNTDDEGATAATFELPLNKATIASGSSATVNGLVNFGKLTFAQESDFTVGGEGLVAFYDEGLEVGQLNANGDRTITFDVPVDFQTENIAVAADDAVVFAKGITNAVWWRAVTEFTIPAENQGAVVLGGVIPAKLTVNGGTLGFTSDVTLPEDDTMVLTIAEGAKIGVPAGMTLRAKTVTYNGVQVGVGYYSDGWVTGGGRVRVDESTTPPVVETATWNAEGSDGLFSESANWDPTTTEMGWAGKYKTIFAAKGTGAVVDGAYDLVDMTFSSTVGSFTLKKGTDDAALTVGSIAFAEGKDEAVERELMIEPPVTLPGQKLWTIPTNDTLTLAGGATVGSSAGSAVKDGAGTLAFHGDSTVNGEVTISNGAIEVVGTLRGSSALRTATLDDKNRYVWLNDATLLKSFAFGNRSASGVSYIRSAAPVGTTNYMASTSDNGTTYTYFERGRAFVIQNCNVYSKHYFGPVGDENAGRTRVIAPYFSQGFRSGDGTLTIYGGTDLLIGAKENTLGTRSVSLNSGASLTILSNDVFTASAADRSFFGVGGDLYLGTTHQVCSQVSSSGNIHGEAGALLEVRFGNAVTFSGNLADHVSFVMNGTDAQTLNGVSTTDGSLTVQQGALVLGANATFKNLSTVVVSGGELTVNAADPFNRETTALTVTDGTINLGAGARVVVASATVGGVDVPRGTYTAAKPGPFEGHLSGEGSLRIGTGGMMFIVK